MASTEFVSLGDLVRFGVCTHNLSGVLQNADSPPLWYAFSNDSDTVILNGNFNARVGMIGTYRSNFPASVASGFNAGDYVEIHASGVVNGISDRMIVKSFVINDPFDGNLVKISGIPIANTGYIADTVWNAQQGAYLTNNTMGSGINKVSQDVYFASIKVVNGSPIPNNEYGVSWFKNGFQVPSGSITNPALSCFDSTTGTALFSNKTLSFSTQLLGVLYYKEGTNMMLSGIPYLITTSGTIGSATQVWSNVAGLDYM